MANTPISDGGGIGSLATTASAIAPLLFGTGTRKESTTTNQTGAPDLIALLRSIVTQSMANSNDPEKTQATVDNIIRQASIAFAPTLGAEGRSGLYSSSTVSQLGKQTIADATAQASKAVLDYQTNQQQIATTGAANLLNATKSTTTAATGATTAGIPPSLTKILGAGILGLSLYKNKDSIGNFLGLGDNSGKEFASASGELTSRAQEALFGPVSDNVGTSISGINTGTTFNATPIVGEVPSNLSLFTTSDSGGVGDFAFTADNAASATSDVSSLFDTVGTSIASAAGGVGDFLSSAGEGIADTGEGLLSSIFKLFDF